MSFVNRALIGLLGLSLALLAYSVPDAYRGWLFWIVIGGCLGMTVPIEQLVWRTRILRRPYYAIRRWLSRKTVTRWRHRLFGHGTIVIVPPETHSSPLSTFMGGAMICNCGKQLGFWDTERRWHTVI